MSYPGALAPPEGVTPDLEHPEDVLHTINYVTQGLTIVMVTIFVGLRAYAKWTVLGGGNCWDDVITYLAYIFMIGYCITGIYTGMYGGGLNQWDVPKSNIVQFFQSGYAATIFYAPMTLFVKLALLIIIARVFGAVHKKTVIGINILRAMLILYYGSGLIIKIRICWPIEAYWLGETDKCLDQSAIITADSILSVISDLAILLLPVPLTWSLQLPMKKKLRVIGLLAAGGLATAFSVYRLIMILTEGASSNQTIVFIKVILSGNAEVGIGLICACLPAVAALFIRRSQTNGYSGYERSKDSKINNQLAPNRIYVNRSFHMHVPERGPEDLELGDTGLNLSQDKVQLVNNPQSESKTGFQSWKT